MRHVLADLLFSYYCSGRVPEIATRVTPFKNTITIVNDIDSFGLYAVVLFANFGKG